ncbi:MAG: xanthine dehydrogenase family protein subunit M [Chloroflexi bacterium]|nr:xanthine dehydrogenase family protein subunit M [Chloroflexota bacterium]
MHWIDFASPHSVREAVELLNEANGSARVLAGGTDLLVQLRGGRFDNVNVVVDGKNIPELNEITYDPDGGLTLGAAVPCYRLYGNAAIARAYPGLIDAASLIGGTQIQGRASFGGNLCNSTPSGDSIPAMIAHNATANIEGPDGHRHVAVEDFCTGPGSNVLGRGEMLVSISFPAPSSGFGANYMRFIPRNEMDIAVAGAGTSVVLENGTIKSARVALAAVAPTPLYVSAIGDAIAGKPANEETLAEAGQMAKDAARPITDMRGTVEYRKHLCDVLTRRSLQIAIDRAKENA